MPSPSSTLFPYTTLFRSVDSRRLAELEEIFLLCDEEGVRTPSSSQRDRKSTRLNSSHGSISYAVFCLKKKNAIKRGMGVEEEVTTHARLGKIRTCSD